ncbi:MAG: hypothetical protein U9Q71_02790 [Pseudomonadota bacterium]|nr:hypothetical protein [Pseudomonadota bacterium]
MFNNSFRNWVGAFIIALLAFYAMDHLIMLMQGLPLSFDLSPAN